MFFNGWSIYLADRVSFMLLPSVPKYIDVQPTFGFESYCIIHIGVNIRIQHQIQHQHSHEANDEIEMISYFTDAYRQLVLPVLRNPFV